MVVVFVFCSVAKMSFSSQLGDLGSGAGKGGGGGGSIREAGGSFGKMEAAREEEYFYKKVSFATDLQHSILNICIFIIVQFILDILVLDPFSKDL